MVNIFEQIIVQADEIQMRSCQTRSLDWKNSITNHVMVIFSAPFDLYINACCSSNANVRVWTVEEGLQCVFCQEDSKKSPWVKE